MAISLGYVAYQRFVPNNDEFTLPSFVALAGSNRMLMVAGLFQRTAEFDFSVAVTYNGVNLSSAVQRTATSSSRWLRAGIWYQTLGDSASDTTADIVATGSVTLAGAILYACLLYGVDQSGPLATTANTAAVPSELSLGYESGGPNGPFGFWTAVTSANALGWSASSSEITPTEAFDLPLSGTDSAEVSGGGYYYIWPDGTDDITAVTLTRSGTPAAQAGVAAKFRPAVVATGAAAGPLVNARRLKSKLRGLV